MKPFVTWTADTMKAYTILIDDAKTVIGECEARKFEAMVVMVWKATQGKTAEARKEAVLSRLAKINATGALHSAIFPGIWKAEQSCTDSDVKQPDKQKKVSF